MSGNRVNKFLAVGFVNDLGQRVEVGDDVVFVIKSTGRLGVRRGKFLGIYFDEKSDAIRGTKVAWDSTRSWWFHKQTGEQLRNYSLWNRNDWEVKTVDVNVKSVLQRNRVYKVA